MAAIHLPDLPEEVLEALTRRAAAHERSLEGELRQILEDAARLAPTEGPPPPLDLVMATGTTATGTADGSWRREELYGDAGR